MTFLFFKHAKRVLASLSILPPGLLYLSFALLECFSEILTITCFLLAILSQSSLCEKQFTYYIFSVLFLYCLTLLIREYNIHGITDFLLFREHIVVIFKILLFPWKSILFFSFSSWVTTRDFVNQFYLQLSVFIWLCFC